MKFLCVLCIISLFVVAIYAQQGSGASVSKPKAGAAVDEVVVESSLYIKKKPQIRRTREVGLLPLLSGRVKRQGHKRGQVSSSQSAANAAANSNYVGQNGFGASAANAQAQGFNTQGPLGSFGASATNAQTQGFTVDKKTGIQGSAAFSGGQTYNLPNGHSLNIAYSNGFSAGPGGVAGSKGNSVTYT